MDRWMIRAKDIIIIMAAVLSFWGYGFKLYTLPGVQEAQAIELSQQKRVLASHDIEIAVLKSGIDDIKTILIAKKTQGG